MKRAIVNCPYENNCVNMWLWDKILRAHGGYLGYLRRRRTRVAAIRSGELSNKL